MMDRRTILTGMVVLVLCLPLAARGDDTADVQAVFDKDLRLFNALNTEAFVASAHDDIVLFGILSPFATVGKESLRQLIQQYFGDHTRTLFMAVNPKLFIAGTSAVAWGAYTITEYPKAGVRQAIHGRYTFTYTKVNSKWLLAAMHLSPLQGY
jgi:uncharacterized protein (TIGR02246 family)